MADIEKHPGGRPTDYKEEYVDLVFRICSGTGASDLQLAKIFEVSRTTINNWKKEHPKFFDSIKKGKDIYDTQNVENSLLKRALGYTVTETTKEPCIVKKKGETAEVIDTKLTITKKVKKHIAPEVAAQIFWLKNRNPGRWRDKQEIEHSGKDGQPLQLQAIVAELKDPAIKEAIRLISSKMVTDGTGSEPK